MIRAATEAVLIGFGVLINDSYRTTKAVSSLQSALNLVSEGVD